MRTDICHGAVFRILQSLADLVDVDGRHVELENYDLEFLKKETDEEGRKADNLHKEEENHTKTSLNKGERG